MANALTETESSVDRTSATRIVNRSGRCDETLLHWRHLLLRRWDYHRPRFGGRQQYRSIAVSQYRNMQGRYVRHLCVMCSHCCARTWHLHASEVLPRQRLTTSDWKRNMVSLKPRGYKLHRRSNDCLVLEIHTTSVLTGQSVDTSSLSSSPFSHVHLSCVFTHVVLAPSRCVRCPNELMIRIYRHHCYTRG